MHDKALEWLKKAKNSISTAELNFESENFEATLEYAHKSSEEALMALVFNRSEKFEEVFDIEKIKKIVSIRHDNIIKLYAYIDLAYNSSRDFYCKKCVTKDECEHVIHAAAEVMLSVQKAIE